MIAAWTVLVLALGVVIARVVVWLRRRDETAALGSVSTAWIAEHSATESHHVGR
jgi:hypothetical protein